jgi:hypothetical protein
MNTTEYFRSSVSGNLIINSWILEMRLSEPSRLGMVARPKARRLFVLIIADMENVTLGRGNKAPSSERAKYERGGAIYAVDDIVYELGGAEA